MKITQNSGGFIDFRQTKVGLYCSYKSWLLRGWCLQWPWASCLCNVNKRRQTLVSEPGSLVDDSNRNFLPVTLVVSTVYKK